MTEDKMLHVVKNAALDHALTHLRDTFNTSALSWRAYMRSAALTLGAKVLSDLPVTKKRITTPLAPMDAPVLEKLPCFVIVMRAADGFTEPLLQLVPEAPVGHIDIARDHETLEPVVSMCKLDIDLKDRPVIVVDPMLATGGSASKAVELVKAKGATNIRFLSLLAAPEGIAKMHADHPDVKIYTGAVDEKLNDKGYIVPGLGDAGDRYYGTGANQPKPRLKAQLKQCKKPCGRCP